MPVYVCIDVVGGWHQGLSAGLLDHYVLLSLPRQLAKLVHKTRRLFLLRQGESLPINQHNSQACCDHQDSDTDMRSRSGSDSSSEVCWAFTDSSSSDESNSDWES